MDDHEIVPAIQDLLDGVAWDPDTIEAITDILTDNGYRIRDLEEA